MENLKIAGILQPYSVQVSIFTSLQTYFKLKICYRCRNISNIPQLNFPWKSFLQLTWNVYFVIPLCRTLIHEHNLNGECVCAQRRVRVCGSLSFHILPSCVYSVARWLQLCQVHPVCWRGESTPTESPSAELQIPDRWKRVLNKPRVQTCF